MRRGRLPIRWLMLAVLLGAPALGGWAWWSRGRLRPDGLAEGRAAYERGDWERAASLARERLKGAADEPEGLRLLGRALVRQGRDDSAALVYKRLGEPALSAEDMYLVGLSLRRMGRRQSAIAMWERARSLDPSHAETLFELTRAYLSSDQLENAARAASDLAGQPGWESRAEALLGSIQLDRNDPDGAVAYWLRALERPRPVVRAEGVPDPIVPRTDVAGALLRAGRAEAARDQLRIALADAPSPEVYWLLSRVDLQRKDWPAARADLERGGSFGEANPMRHEPAVYVGASQCAGCHPAEFQAQQASRHARTFFRDSELGRLVLPASPVPDPKDPSVAHALRRDAEGRIHQQTQAAGRAFDAVVQYAFGSGDRGMTLVGRDPAGHAHELRLSDYPEEHGREPSGHTAARWDLTSGHPYRPDRAEEYLGQPLSEDAVRRCLSCHVTDPKAIVDGSGACASDRSIGCERCHGPGGNHLLAVEGKLVEADPAIARPTLASGARIVNLCAECHSPRGQQISPDDPRSVRFQGSTLTWSRCYTESGDALDCITCHDPHRNATTSPAHYEARCLECHSHKAGQPPPKGNSGPARPRSRSKVFRDGSDRTTCPVNPSTGCIGCHMPAVGGIVPHSSFTDHFIRVHRDGSSR
jgi:tetratricopeptide (TPR) repeat protein